LDEMSDKTSDGSDHYDHSPWPSGIHPS
jgi:hypothetical protein